MSKPSVIEWASFKVLPGVTDEALLAASKSLQEGFLDKQSGFQKRELLRGRDGGWADLLHWESHEHAERAMKLAMESPACAAYFKLLVQPEDPSQMVLHFTEVATYAGPKR